MSRIVPAAVLGLAALLSIPAAGAEPPQPSFEFIVVGDTRPRFESENFKQFEGIIPKINAARPAFVINLGDLIYGYGLRRKERQWDRYEQVVRALTAPYYQLPGNHDIFSRKAERVYARRFGALYRSFDYGDAHFVLLDNCEDTRWGHIGPAQLAWLKDDLQRTRARSVFVFMHFPAWEPERVPAPEHLMWRDVLHPLFRASRVKAVFGGHVHGYGPTREIEGIRYFVTGGGGAELRPEYRKAGGEHHFVKVRVTGDAFDVRVVTDRGELGDGDADVMGGLLFAEKHATRIGITEGAQDPLKGIAFEIAVDNPESEPLVGQATWELDPALFDVSPRVVSVRVPPGETVRLAFTLKALRSPVEFDALPWLAFDLAVGGHRLRFHREALFVRSLSVPFVRRAPVIDGALEEWTDGPVLALGSSGAAGTRVRAAHDRGTLFLVLDVPAANAPQDEASASADRLQIGIAGRSGPAGFGGETLRLGLRATRSDGQGTIDVADRTPGPALGAPLPGVRAAVRVASQRTVYELSIPRKLLPHKGKEGQPLVLSVSVPPRGGAADEPGDPSPGSFAYQVRYGGDVLVPVQFVELILSPARPPVPPDEGSFEVP